MLLFSPRTILAIWGLPLPASASQSETLTEGDLESFLNQHGNHVYTYLCVMCRDEDAASEALQNAYMKFIEQVRRSKVRRDTAAQYLLTIAKNDHFSRVRKESREVELADDLQDGNAAQREARDHLARELQMVLLETAKDPQVPPDIAIIIRLRFLEGADLETICEKTGRSQATVYRLMEKALTILADACRRAGLHPEDAGL